MTEKPPLVGAELDEAVKWLREPPTRLEFYRVAAAMLGATGKIVQGSMAILREEPVAAVDQLQAAIDGLSETLRLMPQMDDAVAEAIARLEAENSNG